MASSPRLSRLLDNPSRPTLGVSPLNAEQQERYEQLLKEFQEIDENGDNNLTFPEIFKFLNSRSSGQITEEVCRDLFNQMDRDHNSEITTKEFVQNYIEIEEGICKKINDQKRKISDNLLQLEENKRKLIKANQEEIMQKNGIMQDSVLSVHVIEVMRFRLYGVGVFIELFCENQVIETEPRPFDPNPVFKEAFTFKIVSGSSDLKIVLNDGKTKKKVAEGVYKLEELKDQFKKDVIVDLNDGRNDGPIGRAHLELQWIYSKVKYFKDIIRQIEENIEKNKFELSELEESLKNIHKPFGIFDFRGFDFGARSSNPLATRITNIFCGIFGRNIRWNFMLSGFMTGFLLLSTIQMFFVSDYLNVKST